jgi:hypothetical protein
MTSPDIALQTTGSDWKFMRKVRFCQQYSVPYVITCGALNTAFIGREATRPRVTYGGTGLQRYILAVCRWAQAKWELHNCNGLIQLRACHHWDVKTGPSNSKLGVRTLSSHSTRACNLLQPNNRNPELLGCMKLIQGAGPVASRRMAP